MDFYGNDGVARAQIQYRMTELQRDARRSVAPVSGESGEGNQWTKEFADWIVSRAQVGSAFMARSPSNP
jgi:hypothetical protein